jgi:hypothetical protein
MTEARSPCDDRSRASMRFVSWFLRLQGLTLADCFSQNSAATARVRENKSLDLI